MTSFPPFSLDKANQCLWRASPEGNVERIVLRPKAFAVLCHLVERSGQLVTEEELLESVWPGVYVQPEAVKGRLFEIRSALKDSPKEPKFIETIPRRGYRFIAATEASPLNLAAVPLRTTGPTGLVGREAELDALRTIAQRCLNDGSQLAFISGEPGIGKTALLGALGEELSQHSPSWRVGVGNCIEGLAGREPYYPVLTALEALCRGPDGHTVIDTLLSHAPTWLVQFPSLLTSEHRRQLVQEVAGAGKERMLREFLSALDEMSTRTAPVLLALEDLHWADEATVDLLSAFARRRARGHVLISGTFRPLELVLENHPLAALKTDLRCRGACTELELDPLGPEAVRRYVNPVASQGTAEANELSSLIFKQSEGNPLFIVSALQNLAERALVRSTGEGWLPVIPVAKIELEVPETLRLMLRAQIERLSTTLKDVLLVASVAGASFAPQDVAAVSGLGLDDVESICHELSSRHRLLSVVERASEPFLRRERYTFAHALYREVLYSSLPSGRRQRLHQAFGEVLELSGLELLPIAAELAYHFENSHDWLKASRYLRLAADQASERFSPGLAVGFLEHAYRLAQHLPMDERPEEELSALERLSEVQLLSYDRRLLSTTMTLADKAATYRRPELEVRALKSAIEFLAGADGAKAMAAIARVEQLCDAVEDPLERARARIHCSAWRTSTEGWRQADEDICDAELAVVHRLAAPKVGAEMALDVSFLKLCGAKYDEAVSMATRSLEVLVPSGRPNPCATRAQAVAAYLQYTGCVFSGRWGEAWDVAFQVVNAFSRNGHHQVTHVMSLRMAWLHLWAQDFSGAAKVCESFESGLGEEMLLTHRRLLNIFSGAAQLGMGNLEKASLKLNAALEALKRPNAYSGWRSRALLDISLFDLHLAQNDWAAAKQNLKDLVDGSNATGERTWQALAFDARARSELWHGDPEQSLRIAQAGLAFSSAGAVPMAEWQLHRTAAAAASTLGDDGSRSQHRARGGDLVRKLASSLPSDHILRSTFLQSERAMQLL